MADVLVIGVGSDLHRDDAVGRRVADAIERRELPGVAVRSTMQLLPELAEPVARADLLIVVDASTLADTVRTRSVVASDRRAGSHDGNLAGLLGLVDDLGLPCPPAVLVEVPVADLSLGDGLTDLATDAMSGAVDVVIDLITEATGIRAPG